MALLRVAMYGTKHPHCAAVAQALQDCADIEFVGGEPFPANARARVAFHRNVRPLLVSVAVSV